jgi:glycosyltransferase involved in cell wall biosynthesis
MHRGSTRVILVSTGVVSLPPRFGAAIESYVYDLAKIFAHLGRDVELVADTNELFNVEGIRVTSVGTGTDRYLEPIPLRATRRPLAGIRTARAALSLVPPPESHDRAVLVLNEEVSAAIIARRLRNRRNARCVFVVHDPPPGLGLNRVELGENIVRQIAWQLTRLSILPSVSAIVTLNPRVSSYLTSTDRIPAESCFSIPLAIDVDTFVPARRANATGEARIAYVGRIDSRKNVEMLVAAMKLVQPGITLRLIGDGPLRNSLERWVSANEMADRIRFLGVVSSEELLKTLQSSDIFLLPSSLEAFPRAALEAAACGLPLILPASSHYVQYFDSGCAQGFEEFSPQSIARAIDALAREPDRRVKLGIAARAFAVNTCGYDAVGRGLEHIFDYCWSKR